MKKSTLLIAFSAMALTVSAQTTIPNGGFENWGNSAPGIAAEPTGWYSNKSGSAIAKLGPQTAFNETASPHSGASCLRLETINYATTPVNGSLTTGVINAKSFNKSEGYIGTVNYSTASDIRRLAFVGRPDSLVGWFKYKKSTSSKSDAATETGKVEMFLHTDQYNAPENANGGNTSANRIATALFVTPSQNQTTWKRFSVPFVYVNGTTPEFAMINMTSSANQTTNADGSKLWLDDLEVIYNPISNGCEDPSNLVITQNPTSVDLSWTAPATAPSGGYGYAIISADSLQTPIPFYSTPNTFKNGITATQAQFSENLVIGRTYNVYVVSFCGPDPNDPVLTLTSNYIAETFLFGSSAGVNETSLNKVQVYSYNNQMYVDLSEVSENNAVLTLIDITGKEVLNVKLNANEKNVIALPTSMENGTYFYNVLGTSIQKTGKIVK